MGNQDPEYPQQSPCNSQYSQYGQQQSYQATAPYPVGNEQYQQYPTHTAPQGYSQQQGYQQQGYQQHVAPPPYSETPVTQQSMPYTSGPPPVVNQPSSYQQNTSVTVGFARPQSQRIYHGPPPPNHMTFSILTCLFCFWPVGLCAIIKSSEVNSANAIGDYFRANSASESAKKMNIVSFIIGCVIYFGILMLIIFAATV